VTCSLRLSLGFVPVGFFNTFPCSAALGDFIVANSTGCGRECGPPSALWSIDVSSSPSLIQRVPLTSGYCRALACFAATPSARTLATSGRYFISYLGPAVIIHYDIWWLEESTWKRKTVNVKTALSRNWGVTEWAWAGAT